MRGRLMASKGVRFAAAGVTAFLLTTAPAVAGTLTVNFNAYQNTTGCDIWSVNGNTNLFGYNPPCSSFPLGMEGGGSNFPAGSRFGMQTTAPAGIAITNAQVSPYQITNINNNQGWGGGSYWAGGGGSLWHDGDQVEADGPFSSSFWGFQMICGWSTCSNFGDIYVNNITLTASENQGPGLVALGSNNLWYQGGHYVWNPAGDAWPIALSASDPSGVCSMGAYVNNNYLPGPSAAANTSEWQQCPNQTWSTSGGAAVDTRDYVSGAGSLPLTLQATNAAQVTSSVSETLNVDNDPVSVALSTPNDPNPSQWVNHAVTVDAAASAGPSGIAGTNCSIDGGSARSYPSSGVAVNGDGVHTVSCTASNNAVNPQGNPNTGTGSLVVRIDEAPPSLSFEAQNPNDPTQLIVDTSDSESGVAGGQVEMARAGTSNWTAVPTSFDGHHLIARFDDAGLSGDYVFQATSCDNVNNCASTSESLTLPVRLASTSYVGFGRILNPLRVRKIRERVRVGWHWAMVSRHGKRVKVKRGGHFKRVTVIKRVERCTHKRVQVGRHRWRVRNVCKAPQLRLLGSKRVGYGKSVTITGLAMTEQGVPLSGQPVQVLTAPNNGLGQFIPVTTATTDANGGWSVKLPAGPSRIIQAAYPGSATVLPATGQATVNVPARLAVGITPHQLPWSGTLTIRGHLVGGYVPPDGVALRLLVLYPGSRLGTPLLALRTNARGAFAIKWTYNAGRGVASYPFWVATTATESDYPFAAGASRHITVTFGLPTPPQPNAHKHRRRHRSTRRRRT